MKQWIIFSQVLLLLLLLSLLVSANTVVAGSYEIKPPPASLSKYYPPESTSLEFTSQMTLMSRSVTAILLALKGGDPEEADKSAGELLQVYKKSSEMVPEWKELFKVEIVKALKESLGSGDKATIKKALKELKGNCEECHRRNRIPVWTKFHWPSFKEIVITDPENESEIKYPRYMESIGHTLNSVAIYFNKNEFKKAGKSLRAFKSRFLELKSTCSKCHINSDVKKIFFGEHITDALSLLKKSLSGEKRAEFNKNMELIRKRGCKMCHLTHLTYSIIKTEWER